MLCEFTDGIAIEKSQDLGLELLALDMAYIELGIAGLLRRLGKPSAHEILQATFQDIDASGRDARHWRSIEATSQRPDKQRRPLRGR